MKPKTSALIIVSLIISALLPAVFAESLHSLDSLAVLISADEYKLQNVPMRLYTTSFGKYCSLCSEDETCCEYCNAPSCAGVLMESSSHGGIADGALNLKFENDFQVTGNSALCPPVSVKKATNCLYADAVDAENDMIWFSIDSLGYVSKRYYLSEIYEQARDIFLIKESFSLSEEDRKAISKSDGDSLFAEEPEETYFKNGIITYRDIGSINGNVVSLNERARAALKEKAKTSSDSYVGLLIVVLVIAFLLYSSKKKKR
ncbi:hypothetical protein JW707_02185 [Candidatus Woesearchaeota archaeon]|nr:hypothetical protein [Candidatus Woesearchaeota archaeon]